MMDNVRTAMARIASIRSTMGAPQAVPAQPATEPLAAQVQGRFTQALSVAAGAYGTAPGGLPAVPTGLTPVAGTRRDGAPPGLESFRNGEIPTAALAPVHGTDEHLWAPAAAALAHLRADAARAGIAVDVVDGYRPHHDQVRLASELGLYKEGGLAAVPGTSQHGWGRAIDLELDDQGLAWMRANAWKYGFIEAVPGEPWHWEFHPAG